MIYLIWITLGLLKIFKIINISWLGVFILPFWPVIFIALASIIILGISNFLKYIASRLD